MPSIRYPRPLFSITRRPHMRTKKTIVILCFYNSLLSCCTRSHRAHFLSCPRALDCFLPLFFLSVLNPASTPEGQHKYRPWLACTRHLDVRAARSLVRRATVFSVALFSGVLEPLRHSSLSFPSHSLPSFHPQSPLVPSQHFLMTSPLRTRCVVDPVWRVIAAPLLLPAWSTLELESQRCGFVGLDLEWTTVEMTVDTAEGDDSTSLRPAQSPSGSPTTRRPRRRTGPVATVQLSTETVTFVFKYCDLRYLTDSNVNAEVGDRGDPCLPGSRSWPNHRVGERENSRGHLSEIMSRLNALLCNPRVTKVGVGIAGDMLKFQRDCAPHRVEPCVDLVTLANRYVASPITVVLPGPAGTNQVPTEVHVPEVRSLREMSVVFCGRLLEKDLSVVRSDWGGRLGALSPMQCSTPRETQRRHLTPASVSCAPPAGRMRQWRRFFQRAAVRRWPTASRR